MDVQNKRALVVGLARSGFAVARALARRGAVVTVTDRKPPAQFRDMLPELLHDKIGLELGSQSEQTFLRHDVIVISPGVPWDLPQLQAARARNIPVYPEVEAASWFLDGTLIGITGSNGKTTTTSLLGDMLKASGFPTFVGGNIGNALSAAIDTASPGTRFVTELSSFQLEGIQQLQPHVAVMLNLSPNHLDRHPSLEAYSEAKRQIFKNQSGEDYAVLNADDPWVAGLGTSVASYPVFFSRQRELPSGVFASGGKVYYRVQHLERVLFETRDVRLRGDFNLEDVLAATTAACVLGADFAAIRKAVREFKAVEHRLEFVSEIQGVDFYNNSKATSVDATLKSLEAFDHGLHLILGGKDKGAPYTPLIPLIKERVREVLLIGAAAPVIREQLAGSAELVDAGDLATAVREAFARARPGETVLLAPACSSFDQFSDYEERGRVFKKLVYDLRGPGFGGRDNGGPRDTASTPKDAGKKRERKSEAGAAAIKSREPEAAERGETEIRSRRPEPDPVPAPPPRPEPKPVPGPEPLPEPTPQPEPPIVLDTPTIAAEAGSASRRGTQETRTSALPISDLPNAAEPGIPEHAEAMPEAKGGNSDSSLSASRPQGAEVAVVSPESLIASPAPQVSDPLPAMTYPVRELRYVYETDAEETAGSESQTVPEGEDEPEIPVSGKAEVVDDELLPFEARAGRPAVRNPKPEHKESESGGLKAEVKERKSAGKPDAQTGLFESSDR